MTLYLTRRLVFPTIQQNVSPVSLLSTFIEVTGKKLDNCVPVLDCTPCSRFICRSCVAVLRIARQCYVIQALTCGRLLPQDKLQSIQTHAASESAAQIMIVQYVSYSMSHTVCHIRYVTINELCCGHMPGTNQHVSTCVNANPRIS